MLGPRWGISQFLQTRDPARFLCFLLRCLNHFLLLTSTFAASIIVSRCEVICIELAYKISTSIAIVPGQHFILTFIPLSMELSDHLLGRSSLTEARPIIGILLQS
jgi:hypothetical protein